MLWVLTENAPMQYPQKRMFSWRSKKTFNSFWLKKKYLIWSYDILFYPKYLVWFGLEFNDPA